MWVYFNQYGTLLKQLIHGTPARKGVVNDFEIVVVFDRETMVSSLYTPTIQFRAPSGTIGLEYPMEFVEEKKFEKVTGEKSVYPFVDGKNYKVYRFSPQSATVLAESGTYNATVRIYPGDVDITDPNADPGTVIVSGEIVFEVEDSVYNAPNGITEDQYTLLMNYISQIVGDYNSIVVIDSLEEEYVSSLVAGQVAFVKSENGFYKKNANDEMILLDLKAAKVSVDETVEGTLYGTDVEGGTVSVYSSTPGVSKSVWKLRHDGKIIWNHILNGSVVGSYEITLPRSSGTIATAEGVANSYVPYTGATKDININTRTITSELTEGNNNYQARFNYNGLSFLNTSGVMIAKTYRYCATAIYRAGAEFTLPSGSGGVLATEGYVSTRLESYVPTTANSNIGNHSITAENGGVASSIFKPEGLEVESTVSGQKAIYGNHFITYRATSSGTSYSLLFPTENGYLATQSYVSNNYQTKLTFDPAPTENSNNPVTSGGVFTAINNAISNVYRYKATKTVAEINALSTASLTVGDVYNVSNSGTLTAGSVSVIAGDDVAWTGSEWNKLAGSVDLSGYVPYSNATGDVNLNGHGITTVYNGVYTSLGYGSFSIGVSQGTTSYTNYANREIKIAVGNSTYTLSLPSENGTLATQEHVSNNYVPYTGGNDITLASGKKFNTTYSYGGTGSVQTSIGGTTIEISGYNPGETTLRKVYLTPSRIGYYTKDANNVETTVQLAFPASDGTIATQEKVASDYVPYTGATSDLDLGSHSLNAEYLQGKQGVTINGVGTGYSGYSATFTTTNTNPGDVYPRFEINNGSTFLGVINLPTVSGGGSITLATQEEVQANTSVIYKYTFPTKVFGSSPMSPQLFGCDNLDIANVTASQIDAAINNCLVFKVNGSIFLNGGVVAADTVRVYLASNSSVYADYSLSDLRSITKTKL